MRARSTRDNKVLGEPRQLPMALDSVPLQTMSNAQRERATAQLARILLLAAGVDLKERNDDDER